MNEQLLYNIAITCLPNIGDVLAKKLIAYCGSAEAVFYEKKATLEKIPGIGAIYAKSVLTHRKNSLLRAEKEIQFIEKNGIVPLMYLDKNYPKRLLHCEDGPVMIYLKGNQNLNTNKVISVVGTRNITDYGKEFCEMIINDLKPYSPVIISGLAYGVDICAHKSAIKNDLSTIGVLAHGLDRIYPTHHRSVAKKMLEKGGVLSDFISETKPDRENFPKRNRIVAGLSDLTLVIESSKKGGSLITAELAHSYNRDVFALPGKISDSQSEGCNWLIKTNKAALIQSVKDIEYIMGWEPLAQENQSTQTKLFVPLTSDQKRITDMMLNKDKMTIDDISLNVKMPMSLTASLLLELEFSGVVKSYPGKLYKLT